MSQPVLLNFAVLPASAPFDTLSKLYERSGTYSTFFSVHFLVLPSGNSVSNFTVPMSLPSSVCPSPRVTSCCSDLNRQTVLYRCICGTWLLSPLSTFPWRQLQMCGWSPSRTLCLNHSLNWLQLCWLIGPACQLRSHFSSFVLLPTFCNLS